MVPSAILCETFSEFLIFYKRETRGILDNIVRDNMQQLLYHKMFVQIKHSNSFATYFYLLTYLLM